jgi:RNA-directed DNA polymerase
MTFKYDLRRIKSKKQLLSFMSIEEEEFDRFSNFFPKDRHSKEKNQNGLIVVGVPLFAEHHIPKRNPKRGYRTVWEAPSDAKNIYKALSRRLDNFFTYTLSLYPHPNAFGYVIGRNIKENAEMHCGKKNIQKLDIESFFPTISRLRIKDLFESLGVVSEVSDLLANFVTIDEKLPLGLSPSPNIANAICMEMDIEFTDLAREFGANYTRYADDITFSSDGDLPSLAIIQDVLKKHSFQIAAGKSKASKIGQAHYVTGLSVSDPNQPHVPKVKKHRLRQELYYANKFGLDDHFRHHGIDNSQFTQSYVNHLDGLVKFVAFHEPQISHKLKSTWFEILRTSGHRPSFAPKNQHRSPFDLYFDESDYRYGNETRLAIGVSSTQHQIMIDEASQNIWNEILSDPWIDGKREQILKNGLHFTDATEDMRMKYVEKLQTLPFEGYIGFSTYSDPKDYEDTYLRILRLIVPRRLMAAESSFARLWFEETDKVGRDKIRKVVQSSYDELEKHNNRRPEQIAVEFVEKPTFGTSVPDFLLGVLGKYLASGQHVPGKPHKRQHLMFERLRDKYRYILDADSNLEYSRRQPILPW